MGHPTCIIEGLACWLTLCILEKIICNSTNSVQISFIETLKLIVFSWTIWWCYSQNVLMINEKNNFLTVSWLSGLLSAEIFISTGEWGVQMPPLTSENSYFLRSGPQGATLVMYWNVQLLKSLRNLADCILGIPTSWMPCSMSIRQTWTRISGLRDIARFYAKKSYCSLYWHHGTLLPAATSLGLERRKTGWADTWKPQSASQWRRMNIMTSSITHNPAVCPSACED